MRTFEKSARRLSYEVASFLLAVGILSAQTDDLAALSHQGRELMAAGRFSDAIPIYQKLVAAVPGNPGLILNLGLAEQMAGQPRQAIAQFQAVLRLQPDSVPALTSLATSALQTNQPKLAIAPLEKLIQLKAADQNARGMLAGAYMSVDRFSDAAAQYRSLTASDPNDAKGWYGLGKAYEALAERAFGQLSRSAPQSPYVAALLADTRLQRGQYRSAFFFYREALNKLPNLPGIHAGLAKVYENTGHTDWAAVEKAKEASAAACTSPTAECRFLAGDLIAATKRTEASPVNLFWSTRAYNLLAARAFDHLATLSGSVEIHALKAQIFHGHSQDAEAAEEWKKALALAPGDPRLQTELITSLFLAHKYDEVMPLLASQLVNEPAAADLNFMMGESLWQTQQADKAEPYLERALKAQPNLLPAHAALGLVYAQLNRHAEAVPHLQKALSLDDDGSLHYSLARAYQAAGDTPRAQEAMQQSQQIRAKNQQINDDLAKQAEITAPSNLH